jgi:selenocysteine lyase/cysteine desulfurase
LTAGVRYVVERGLADIHRHETVLTERLWQRLEQLPGYTVFGHRDMARRVGTLSFCSRDIPDPLILGAILDQQDIAVRPGLHCAPYIHRSLGTFGAGGLVRVSPGPFSTEADIDALAQALAEIAL